MATAGISEQLRAAIRSAESLYEIEQATGINHAVLGRFLSGERDIRLATAERLCQHFGLTLVKQPARPK